MAPALVERLVRGAGQLPFDISIFSGARTQAHQAELEAAGRPAADWDKSTHADRDRRGCPRLATGADVWPTSDAVRLDRAAVAQLGAAMTFAGLRWGGGSPVGDDGIPSDRFHFDLGPRYD